METTCRIRHGIHQGFFPIDGIDLLVVDIIRHFDGVDKIDAEREHIAIVYGIDNSVVCSWRQTAAPWYETADSRWQQHWRQKLEYR